MMRRIAVIGSILLGLSALAAMGLAQSGQSGHARTSLADRLSALRESVGPPASTAPAHVPHVSEAARERSVLTPIQSRPDPVQRQSTARREPAAVQSQERPRRPRLFSNLDPLSLLLGGGDSEDRSRDAAAVPARSGADVRSRAGGRRAPASHTAPSARQSSAHQDSRESSVAPPLQRHYQVRRSPLAHRAEEELPTSKPEPSSSEPVALGPAASESVALPSLDRPVSNSLSALGTTSRDASDRDGEPASTIVPGERSLESSRAALLPDDQEDTPSESSVGGSDSAPSSVTASVDGPAAVEPQKDRYAEAGPTDVQEVVEAAEPVATVGVQPHDEASAERPTVANAFQEEISAADSNAAVSRPAPDVDAIADSAGDEVLSSDEAPAVAWQISGPRQIIIGREATFSVRLRNDGEHLAERLIARIEVPGSAEIVSAEATHGVGQRVEDGATSAVLEWRIDQLAPSRESVLKLRVVPRTNQSMNMQVSVRAEPRAAMARVEVLEPKLKLALEGPSDVLFGEARHYRVTVTNPGTGPAENVVVLFTPPGQEERSAQRHTVGLLEPGHSKTLEVDVTPQTPGQVAMKVVASADGDLRDQTERHVLVRRPELVVDARGPRTTYAGTVATYYFRVQNTGDATANDVNVAANLPMGAEFVRAADDRKLEPNVEKNAVNWQIGSLSPGEELYIELKYMVNWAGENTLEVLAEGEQDGLKHTKSITTHVVALADLKLEVADPKGPVAVGKEAVYEVRIRNRGSNTAEQVNVVALFSEGIDPIGVEGGQHSIENGRVAFRTIESLPAGREITFKIRAVAKDEGTHVFRTEVLCRELETKLAAEETTRFYLSETSGMDTDAFRAAAANDGFDLQ